MAYDTNSLLFTEKMIHELGNEPNMLMQDPI